MVGQVWHNTLVDPVGVHDNGALLGLAENLGESHPRHHMAAQQVVQHVARSHGRQLIRVTHQYQAAIPPHGGQQGGHQGHVHHGGLVHNDGIHPQGVVLVLGKGQLSGVGVHLGLQQPVDGVGILSTGLAHALGGSSRRSGQSSLQPQVVKEGQHSPQRSGLASTRTAGEEHHLAACRQLHSVPLLLSVGNALAALDVCEQLVQVVGRGEFHGTHLAQAHSHIALRPVQPR